MTSRSKSSCSSSSSESSSSESSSSESKSSRSSEKSDIFDIINTVTDESMKIITENKNNIYYGCMITGPYDDNYILELYKKCKTMFVDVLKNECGVILNPCSYYKRMIANKISRKRTRHDNINNNLLQTECDDNTDTIADRILRGYEYVFNNSLSILETPTLSQIYLNKEKSILVSTHFQDFLLQPENRLKYTLTFPDNKFNNKHFKTQDEMFLFHRIITIFEKMLLSEISDILSHFDQIIITERQKIKSLFQTIMNLYENKESTHDEKYFEMCRLVSNC
jgi:hypothetical protein